MIKVEHLTKSFGNVRAVDDLSFEVHKGEVVGFLGPNGAGKTTTMRIITGFYSPDEGDVRVANIPVRERLTEAQQYIGYMPENNPLYENMLVSEVLNFFADLRHIPKQKRRAAFDFAVGAVGIGDIFYHPVAELSKGYKQRVGIAVALLHQPRILVMDEPTEGLDPNQRAEIRTLIRNLAKNHTIIMSTHVMQEAQAVCSRLIIINKGKLIADGTSEELSRAAQKERTLLLEVEGNDIEPSLRGLSGIEHIDIEQVHPYSKNFNGGIKTTRFRARLVTDKSTELQPKISSLARAKGWTIWSLHEEEHKLEDVFRRLTNLPH